MAVLELEGDPATAAPLRRPRRIGALFVAVGFVAVNFIVDMLYAVLDPRIRHGRA
jgi:hypothetical protein